MLGFTAYSEGTISQAATALQANAFLSGVLTESGTPSVSLSTNNKVSIGSVSTTVTVNSTEAQAGSNKTLSANSIATFAIPRMSAKSDKDQSLTGIAGTASLGTISVSGKHRNYIPSATGVLGFKELGFSAAASTSLSSVPASASLSSFTVVNSVEIALGSTSGTVNTQAVETTAVQTSFDKDSYDKENTVFAYNEKRSYTVYIR